MLTSQFGARSSVNVCSQSIARFGTTSSFRVEADLALDWQHSWRWIRYHAWQASKLGTRLGLRSSMCSRAKRTNKPTSKPIKELNKQVNTHKQPSRHRKKCLVRGFEIGRARIGQFTSHIENSYRAPLESLRH